MDMKAIVNDNPLLAIMRNIPLEQTVDYAKAVTEGGVSFFEVALNSPGALEQISMLRKLFGDSAVIGAGTAITVERAKAAIEAGAQFLLAPSSDEDVLSYCSSEKIAMLPGALTPSDVSLCLKYGYSTIKLFPAGDMPRGYIKSLKGPFDNTEYVAIGGVNRDNAADFMKQGYLGIGLSSNLMPKAAVAAGDWKTASQHVNEILEEIKRARKG